MMGPEQLNTGHQSLEMQPGRQDRRRGAQMSLTRPEL